MCLTEHIHRAAGYRQSRRARYRGEIGVLGKIGRSLFETIRRQLSNMISLLKYHFYHPSNSQIFES